MLQDFRLPWEERRRLQIRDLLPQEPLVGRPFLMPVLSSEPLRQEHFLQWSQKSR